MSQKPSMEDTRMNVRVDKGKQQSGEETRVISNDRVGKKRRFVEDPTGKKYINSYCLRYAIQVMEAQAKKTCLPAEKRLFSNGDIVSFFEKLEVLPFQ